MSEHEPDQDWTREDVAESLSQLAQSGIGIPVGSHADDDALVPRVMVVDDDYGFRTMVRSWLVEEGVDVVAEAPDGPEAVARAAQTHPDVVLMDLRMPKMDGIEAASRILSTDPDTQIILLSAYGDASLKQAAQEAGVYCYLIKDCPPSVLWRTIRFAWTLKLSLKHRGRAAAQA